MTFLDKLERKFGAYAIGNIAAYLVVGQVAVWVLSLGYVNHDGTNALFERMFFDSRLVLEGEFWRVFAFPLIPPFSHPLFLFFAWYIFYMMAGALESQWGAFRLNVYLLLGAVLGMGAGLLLPGIPITNAIWGQTIFLAFAYLFPDFELRLFFVLPVKVRWLGWLVWGMLALMFVASPWRFQIFILGSVANFFFFFGKEIVHNLKSKKRLATMKAEKVKQEAEPFHSCSQCGATDKSHPDRDFRYRSNACVCDSCLESETSTAPEESVDSK